MKQIAKCVIFVSFSRGIKVMSRPPGDWGFSLSQLVSKIAFCQTTLFYHVSQVKTRGRIPKKKGIVCLFLLLFSYQKRT